MTTIFYATLYGSTKQYAEALADRLGVEAHEINENSAELIDAASSDPIVVFSPVHGSFVRGAKFLNELGADVVEKRKVCLAAVGMALDGVNAELDQAGSILGELADHVKRVYLPGRINYSELEPEHYAILESRIDKKRELDEPSVNDQMLIDTFGEGIDRVDLSRIDEIVEWLES
ncbi:flavodoxin domain-containing protein [Corynebacterium sp. p3-SID1145]|uniref:flavodoxin domain-containing protein n=1 Tax=unclassified Corynebacterium TaxID=2624378 RepID=UPI0021AA296A|nr:MULTISPECIES: flavodoxin domain-containing protein [unclassified Corynebacterium]MCT1451818.1 flavodoxin domain-containing protein [Corynebacterium sp. p3-SID1145]MCT1460915.1 flavodoxin domain-containing protein [Corynebacterium sp. p3-SID1140]